MTIAYDYKTRTSYTEGAAAQKAAHKVLLRHTFEPSLPERGYTNRTLHIDLSTLEGHREGRHPRDEGDLHRRPRLRPLVPVERDHADDEVERPRERHRHQPGAARREHRLRRLRQVARRHAVAAHRHSDRQQRRRLLRPAPQVLRLRRARDPGQGRAGRRRPHRRPEEDHHDRGGARGEPRQPRRGRGVHAPVRRRREGLRERVGGVGGQGGGAQPDRLPELLVVRPQARRGAPEAGRARRHRPGVPRQEDQGAGGARPEDEGRPQPRRRLPADDEGRAGCWPRRSTTSTTSSARCGRSAPRTWSRSWTPTTCCRCTTSSTASTRTSTRSTRPCGRSGSRRASSTAAGTAATWRAPRAPTATR